MRPLILILLALSFNASAANPPKESFDRMNAAFPDIVFITLKVNPPGFPTIRARWL